MNKTNSGIKYYPPSSEKQQKISKRLNKELFLRLHNELDACIDKALERYFRDILEKIRILIEHPCEGQIPAMILSGHCIDWPIFTHLINKLFPNVYIIKQKASATDIWNIFDKIEAEKLIIFFEHDGSDYFFFKEFSEKIKGIKVPIFIVFLSPISCSSVYDKMPRRVAIHMRLSNATFHPFNVFLRILFDETLPLCFLKSNGVLIKAPPQHLYEMDNRSVNSVRKSLLLALCCYAIHDKKLPSKNELISIQTQMKIYSVLLGWFFSLLCGDSGSGMTALHCKLQNDPESSKTLLEKLKLCSKSWTKDNWKSRLQSLFSILQHLGTELERERIICKQLISNLESYNKLNIEEVENNAPDVGNVNSRVSRSRFPIRKSTINTSSILMQRDKDLKRLRNPLSESLQCELLNFLNTLFLDRCAEQKWKYIAEYNLNNFGDYVTSLCPALSTEIDYQLGEISKNQTDKIGQKQQQQLDICLVYGILVQYGIDRSAIQLNMVYDSFYQIAPKIDGMDFNARFMAAVAQLEYIGAVKQLSEGVVRLIYLPVAAFTQDIFRTT